MLYCELESGFFSGRPYKNPRSSLKGPVNEWHCPSVLCPSIWFGPMDAEWKLVVSLLVCFVSSHITLSILTAVGLGGRGLSSTRMSPFWILSELRMMEMTTRAVRHPVKLSLPTNQHPTFYTKASHITACDIHVMRLSVIVCTC